MIALLVNGVAPANPSLAIGALDRGLNYGDGLFETMLYRGGTLWYLDAHMSRLAQGCQRLGITGPDENQLHDDIRRVCADATEGVVKVVITRGGGGRGYRPAAGVCGARIVSLHALPAVPARSTVNLR